MPSPKAFANSKLLQQSYLHMVGARLKLSLEMSRGNLFKGTIRGIPVEIATNAFISKKSESLGATNEIKNLHPAVRAASIYP